MIRHKWIIGARNKLVTIWAECDSCAAIEGACMTDAERDKLKDMLKKAIIWIDKRIEK
jgi:hypothetical protein